MSQKLENSRSFLKNIINSVADPIFVKDRKHRWIEGNTALWNLFGKSEAELLGKSDYDFFSKEEADVFWQKDEEVFNTGKPNINVENFTDASGVTHIISTKKTCFTTEDGEQILVGIIHDITELSHMQEKLRESDEARLKSIMDHTGRPVYIKDLQGRYLGVNKDMLALLGCSEKDIIGKTCYDFFPKDYTDVLIRHDHEVIEKALAIEFEEMVPLPDGMHTYSSMKFPLYDTNGSIYAVCGISTDITERKLTEAAKSLLASIVESTSDSITSETLDGKIISWNIGAEKLYGYSAAEVIGQSFNILLPPDKQGEGQYILSLLREGKRIERFQTVRRHKDGHFIDVSLTISPIYNALGKIAGITKITRDITTRKQAEDALKEADRRKNEFLATLAHELRNPLAPINNALDVLQLTGMNSAQYSEAVEIMRHQVKQMVRLVDDLLDVSRISHGKIELRKEHITLRQIIDNAMETASSMIETDGHPLSIILPDEPLWLDADLLRTSQIFINLLNNAAKYTPTSGNIRLEATRVENDVVVRVSDTGIGIPASMLPRIFEMFTQVDSTIEKAHGGLGIGLMLVKSLVELHGGSVKAYSKGVNQGSEFVVSLPLALSQKSVGEPPSATVQELGPEPKHLSHKLRVLVVDDNIPSAKTLGWMVEMLEHEATLAHDGMSAIAMAKSYLPDMILLDIGLPGMSGYEVCKKIREIPELQHTVLVAQTGWGQQEHRQRSKETGFDHHLVKPVGIESLQEIFLSLDKKNRAA